MKLWRLQFLGVPCAHRDDQNARLRSKETWATLASLILPSLLREESPSPIARKTLTDRFWANSEAIELSGHLRQCLVSLRAAFGERSLLSDRHDIQVATGWFTTDIALALSAYRNALQAPATEERLDWLIQAEREIRGEFFEGWSPHTAEAQSWLIQTRSIVNSRLIPILALLAETLEEVGELNGALDIAQRILEFQPTHKEARESAWRLALATGQKDALPLLEKRYDMREVIANFSSKGLHRVTLKDKQAFEERCDAEIDSLTDSQKGAFRRLSALKTPFPPELAHGVCNISLKTLKQLANTPTPLLESCNGAFFIPEVVREYVWKRMPTITKQRLRKSLTGCCVRWMVEYPLAEGVENIPFASREQARPYLEEAVQHVLEQNPNTRHMTFLNHVRYRGFFDAVFHATSYLQAIRSDESLDLDTRLYAGCATAYTLEQTDRHSLAMQELEVSLDIATSHAQLQWLLSITGTLMRVCHYAGESAKGREYGLRALVISQNQPEYAAYIYYFLGEIAFHTGEWEEALQCCNTAVLMSQHPIVAKSTGAKAHYGKARALFALERWGESEAAIEQALAVCQQIEDTAQISACLVHLGRTHQATGRYAEAQAHIEHAILLHERAGGEASRFAAVEALGDIYEATKRYTEAQTLYSECLQYYTREHKRLDAERLQAKAAMRL